MLDVHRRHVDAGPATQPPRGQLDFVGPLQHNEIHRLIAKPVDGYFLGALPMAPTQPATVSDLVVS